MLLSMRAARVGAVQLAELLLRSVVGAPRSRWAHPRDVGAGSAGPFADNAAAGGECVPVFPPATGSNPAPPSVFPRKAHSSCRLRMALDRSASHRARIQTPTRQTCDSLPALSPAPATCTPRSRG